MTNLRIICNSSINQAITPEQAMSSLMYPKVFSDYMGRINKCGPLLHLLPTRVYWYSIVAGDAFSFSLNKKELSDLLITRPAFADAAADNAVFTARVELVRVGALQHLQRTVVMKVQVMQQQEQGGAVHEEVQQVLVKDTGGIFVFEGPMADAAQPLKQVSKTFIHIFSYS